MKIQRSVRRFDLGELKKATRTPQGFLMAPGFATRTGVFPYRDSSGQMRYELRHPDDVMDPSSLETLRNAPFTIEHPPEMVTPSNVARYRKGHTTDRVEVNRDLVEVDVIIEDQDAIDAVEKDGIRELSSGYTADIVQEAGVYNGTPYNFRQKNIRYNHLAGVRRGRAGPEVRLRLDSADAIMDADVSIPARAEFSQESSDSSEQQPKVDAETKKVVISGQEVDLPSGIADVIQDMLDRYDEMRAQILQMEESMSKEARKDVDVSQPGVSPQVKVEQPGPDGRSSSGKAGPGDKSGAAAAKGDADGKDEKKDYDGKGEAKSPVDQIKDEMEALKKDSQAKLDSMQAKLDEYAAASMNQGEAKPKMDSADTKAAIRARVGLERTAEKLVPFEVAKKFDSMSDDEIRAAVIRHKHPGAKLEGKSTTYLESRFDSIVETAEEGKGESLRQGAGKAMLGLVRNDAGEEQVVDVEAARRKMIQDSRELHKSNLTHFKK